MNLTPYIIFNGNCEEALNFYAQCFDGEVKNLMRFEGSPAADMAVDKQQVLHAHFFAEGIFIMASDSGQGGPTEVDGGKVHLSINFETAEKQDKVFNALQEGGRVTMPLQDTFWGARFGTLTDKYGINWMFNYDKQGPDQ